MGGNKTNKAKVQNQLIIDLIEEYFSCNASRQWCKWDEYFQKQKKPNWKIKQEERALLYLDITFIH